MQKQQIPSLDFEPIPINRLSAGAPNPHHGDHHLGGLMLETLEEAPELGNDLQALVSLDQNSSSDVPPSWTPIKNTFFEDYQPVRRPPVDFTAVSFHDKFVPRIKQYNTKTTASDTPKELSPVDLASSSMAEPSVQQSGKWHERYEQLRNFRSVSGHCHVPTGWKENPSLAQWVKRQRYQYKLKQEGKHSTMTEEREKALENLGFVWDSHSNYWEDRLAELEEFREKHGHCNVPTRYQENPRLAIWAKVQRRQFKLFCSKGSRKLSNMTLERISRLSSLGFVFNPRIVKRKSKPGIAISFQDSRGNGSNSVFQEPKALSDTCDIMSIPKDESYIESNSPSSSVATPSPRQTGKWYDRYAQLCEFHKETGNCNVPSGWKKNPSLAQWVKRQRYQYKLKQEGRHSTITEEREKLLGNLGFVWDSHSNFWEDRLAELEEFRQKHGHSNVPTKYPENPQLSIWAKVQRRQFKLFCSKDPRGSSSMTLERISRLSNLGFVFNPRQVKRKPLN